MVSGLFIFSYYVNLSVVNSQICFPDDASIKPEDANYTVDVLTRCAVRRDKMGKKSVKIVPLKEVGEPIVVTVPLSQVTSEAVVCVLHLQTVSLNLILLTFYYGFSESFIAWLYIYMGISNLQTSYIEVINLHIRCID